MKEKTEWEVVDAPASAARPSLAQLMQKLLGRRWRWKVGGAVVLAGLGLMLLVMLSAMMALLMVAGAVVSIGIGRFKQWRRRNTAGALVKNPMSK